jgi:hypothetical protein
MFARLRSTGFYGGALDAQFLLEFLFEIFLPIVGIALEVVKSKFAKWVNVGCFAGAGCFWLAAAVWWRSDSFFGVLLIVAVALFAIAGITEAVYRSTAEGSPVG